ncbi:MAG TPA: hypothetical protein VF584_21365 [Longimicrobium sp.]|jgi:hypothetical protein
MNPQPSPPPTRPRSETRWSARLAAEGLLIVLSVVLGLALNEWRQKQADRQLARTVLANFRREITQNLRILEKVQPGHAELARRLAAASARPRPEPNAFAVIMAEMPRGGLGGEPLHEAAWETASSTGALRLLDYATASRISEVYVVQRFFMEGTTQRTITSLLAPANFEPGAKQVMLQAQHMALNEFSTQEAYLINVYRRTLKALPPER